jgi:Tfp pilus tip-associated adhesin PilY1
MNYSLPASPAAVDTDSDGFIDTVYLGDLGGNMWRFKFCSKTDGATCNSANWDGGLLFQSSSGVDRPIFTIASIVKDSNGILWIYWGTGDKTDPTAINVQERVFAVKDNDRTRTYQIGDLVNISSSQYSDSSGQHGWYINLPGTGEKVLAEPTVFGGILYFTTYTPPSSGDPCSQAGTATLYGLQYVTGAGFLIDAGGSGGSSGGPIRTMRIGTGIPTAPVLSFKPGGFLPPDLYVTVSGGGGSDESTMRVNVNPPTLSQRTNLLTWKDRRLQ